MFGGHGCQCQTSPTHHNSARNRNEARLVPRVTREQFGAKPSDVFRFTFDLEHVRLDIVDSGALTTNVEGALRSNPRSLLAINAGFFGLTGAPEGLSLADGRTWSALSPSASGGVLTVHRGRAHLYATEEFTASPGMEFGIQCRPRLVVDRQVNIRSESGQRAERNALCIKNAGRELTVYITRTDDIAGMSGPTLLELAQLMNREGCDDALNLDGGPSASAAWPTQQGVRTLSPRAPVRQFIVVSPR